MKHASKLLFFLRLSTAVLVLTSLQGCGWNPFGAKESYVRRGREFAAKGKFDDAELQFRKALQKDSQYGEAYLRYGQALKLENKIPEALYCLSRSVDLMPHSEEAKTELGRTAITSLLGNPRRPQGLYQVVSRTSTELLAMNPKSSEAFRLKGYLAVVDSHPTEAITYFRKSLQAKADQPDVLVTLAQTLILDNQGAEAERTMRDALATLPSYGPLYDALYGYYMSSNRLDDGERVLQTKIARNPKESFFVVQLAEHYWKQKRPEDSKRVLRSLVDDSRKYPAAQLDAGDFYSRVQQFDEAIAYYQEGIHAHPADKKEYQQRIVGVRLTQGRNSEAAAMIDDLLKQFPDDKFALESRADLRMATGKPVEIERALSDLSVLATKFPDDSRVHNDLARAYRQTGKQDEAESTLRDLLQHDPNNREALREIADLAIRAQKPGEALQYAEHLLELDPNNTGARLVRTSAWALRGRFGDVRSELRRLTTESPGLVEGWLQFATLDIEQKNFPEAEQILRRLYRPGGTDIRPLKALVLVYLSSGRPEQAVSLAQDEAAHSRNPEVRSLLATTAVQAGQLKLALATAQGLTADFPENKDYLVLVEPAQSAVGTGRSGYFRTTACAEAGPRRSSSIGAAERFVGPEQSLSRSCCGQQAKPQDTTG